MSFSSRLIAYLQLCRLAAVFTAIADIVAGLALSHQLVPLTTSHWLLISSSVGLYLSGMVFNDYFDRDIDAVERPKRPIPSGRVDPRQAKILAIVLMAGGILLAGLAGWFAGATFPPLLIAIALAIAILGYDGWLKNTVIGPISMGFCRFLNLMLGASFALGSLFSNATSDGIPDTTPLEPRALLTCGAAVWIYISGVTWFAKNEASQSRRRDLIAASVVVNAGLVVWFAFYLMQIPMQILSTRATIALVCVAITINRPLWRAISDPTPRAVQMGVRTMLTWLIMLDAIVIFASSANTPAAITVALLMFPAQWIGRRLAIT